MTTHFSIGKGFTAQLLIFFMLISLVVSSVHAQVPFPPEEEVNALREIADQLGKRDWNFSLNPCDSNTNWSSDADNDVTCGNCTADECHVTHISLKRQDLAGVPPPSLWKLPYITHIDLFGNYLSGTIPPEWVSTKLQYLALGMNRLSGPIPEYLGNISTLKYISLETNMFSENVPASLGKLTNLDTLLLHTNNLTGGLPVELSYLTKLTVLSLSSNNFVGQLPNFDRWTKLQRLEIQGSGFEGPIPDSISRLKNLTELRISDLKGKSSDFPQLGDMVGLTTLLLRSCNISGRITSDLSMMSQLYILDLSFNNLQGEIPNFGSLPRLEFVYLTSNFFSGPIPNWIQNPSSKRCLYEGTWTRSTC